MSMLGKSVPASLRRPPESTRIAPGIALGLTPKATKSPQIARPEGRAASLVKSRFAPLPQEPEDARLTGVTRSLHRRLLALNVSGTLRMGNLLATARIA
jgi:hypothetical protein